jgi:hypothetical protein
VHGVGGVGKTTITALLVHEPDVRSSFEKIVWVSIGQEPDVRELQNSIHFQLCNYNLPEHEAHETAQVLKDAAAGTELLLVLDDVWDSAMEKPFNCIDPSTSSRLLVSTRIRGLLWNSTEVELGVLPADEALVLLLASAGIPGGVNSFSSDKRRGVVEVVELCGRLPLTLAITGSMIGPDFTAGILEAIMEVRDNNAEGARAFGGLTLEERVISTSLNMIKGKNKARVFKFFAVFPEHVAVPAGFFNALTPLILGTGEGTMARLAVGGCLATLVKFNLLKGSVADGVFMHDIVRDFVINQHTEAELRALQRDVVEAVVAARPDPDGFDEYALSNTFDGYIARQLFWHIRGALDAGEEPPGVWLIDRNQDPVVKVNAAAAFGFEKLEVLVAAKEAAGQLVHAAQVAWEASFLKQVPPAVRADLMYRAAGLLEEANDPAVATFELQLLAHAFAQDRGTERWAAAQRRRTILSDADPFHAKDQLALSFTQAGGTLWNYSRSVWPGPTEGEVREGTRLFLGLEASEAEFEAGALASNPIERHLVSTWFHYLKLGWSVVSSPMDHWNPSSFYSEAAYLESCESYSFRASRKIAPCVGIGLDIWLIGTANIPMTLFFGSLQALDIWHEKALEAFRTMALPVSRSYGVQLGGFTCVQLRSSITLLLLLNQAERAQSLLAALGFEWSTAGFECCDAASAAMGKGGASFKPEPDDVLMRLLMFLSSPPSPPIDKQAGAWIPTPAELANHERDYGYARQLGMLSILNLGARAFLKLGRDDEAVETARIAVSVEQQTMHKYVLVECHSVLGQVAAKRGNVDEAGGHFGRAVEEARASRLPMLEVLAARDWKRAVSESGAAADVAIDGACAKMGKTRAQLASVLLWLT